MSERERAALKIAAQYYDKRTYDHAFTVALYAKEMAEEKFAEDSELIEYCFIVGIFHDLIEDTSLALDELEGMLWEESFPAGCRQSIIEAVDSVSQRDGESYKDYMYRLLDVDKDPVAIIVKKADFKDHFARVDTLTPKLMQKYAPYVWRFL